MNKYLEDRPYLNTFIQSARSMTLRDYSLKLNDVKPLQLTSDKLLKALHQTTNKSFYEDEQAIFKKLIHHPIIQTSHHISPSYGLWMTTADIIASLCLPAQNPYVIGACSAVPLQNKMYSYALLYASSPLEQLVKPDSHLYRNAQISIKARSRDLIDEKHINLLSVKQTNKRLTYGTMFDYQKIRSSLSNMMIQALPEMNTPNYCHWSMQSSVSLQRHALNRQNICGLDINEWIKEYLLLEYEESNDCFFSELFFCSVKRMKDIMVILGDPLILTLQSSKTNQIEFYTMKDICERCIFDRKKCVKLFLELLKQSKCVPSAFLVYTLLELFYGFHCLGSYRMFEYLHEYREGWQAVLRSDHGLLPYLEEKNPYRLTLGAIDQIMDLPLDLRLKGMKLKIDDFKHLKMYDLWPMFGESRIEE